MTLLPHREDLVLGAERPDHVSRIHPNQVAGDWRADILVTHRRRRVRVRDPVGQGKDHIQVFRQNQIGYLGKFAVKMQVAAKPASCRHVHPTFQGDVDRHFALRDADRLLMGVIRFPRSTTRR